MTDAAHLDSIRIWTNEEEPIVADAQPQFFSTLESFHVAYARFREAMQGGENLHSDGFAQAADIDPSWIGPHDLFHLGS